MIIYIVLANFIALIVFLSVYIDKYRGEKDRENKLIALSLLLGITMMVLGFFIYTELFDVEKAIGNRKVYNFLAGRLARQVGDIVGDYMEKNKELQGVIADFLLKASKA
jgi:hypothetical protein